MPGPSKLMIKYKFLHYFNTLMLVNIRTEILKALKVLVQ